MLVDIPDDFIATLNKRQVKFNRDLDEKLDLKEMVCVGLVYFLSNDIPSAMGGYYPAEDMDFEGASRYITKAQPEKKGWLKSFLARFF